jgi:hypothetical protein
MVIRTLAASFALFTLISACGSQPAAEVPGPTTQPISVGPGNVFLVLNSSGTAASNWEVIGTGVPLGKLSALTKGYYPIPKVFKDLAYSPSPLSNPPIQFKLTHESNSAVFSVITNFSSSGTVLLGANLVYGTVNSACLIYLATNANVGAFSAGDWTNLGANFDTNIYVKMTNGFGNPSDIDANGKVVILYYPIQAASGFIFGYFSSGDLIPSQGNNMEVFYMNTIDAVTYPPDNADMIRTLAHEFQHLINFSQRNLMGKTSMDTWLNEGLAESAEQYVAGTIGQIRFSCFTNSTQIAIRNGHPLCVWDNSNEAYTLSYLFMQYCKNNAPAYNELFKMVITQNDGTYAGLTSVMMSQNTNFKSFSDILKGFRLANLFMDPATIYGYGSENGLFSVLSNGVFPPSLPYSSLQLLPGGAVYLIYSSNVSFQVNNYGQNIQYFKAQK